MFLGFVVASLIFHFFFLGVLGRFRYWLYSHQIIAFGFVLLTDAIALKFVGASAEAGMANVIGGGVIELWILIMGVAQRSRSIRYEFKFKKKYGLPCRVYLAETQTPQIQDPQTASV